MTIGRFITKKSVWPITGGVWGLFSYLYFISNAVEKYFDLFGTGDFVFPLSFKVSAFPVWILFWLDDKLPDFIVPLPDTVMWGNVLLATLSTLVGFSMGFLVFSIKKIAWRIFTKTK